MRGEGLFIYKRALILTASAGSISKYVTMRNGGFGGLQVSIELMLMEDVQVLTLITKRMVRNRPFNIPSVLIFDL